MTDSSAVLSVTGQEAIVDWVFIEIRDKDNPDSIVTTRPALLNRHGGIVELDGVSPPRLWNIPYGEYNVVIRHRNHLGVRTSQPILLEENSPSINFAQTPAYGNGTKQLANGSYVLYGGDANGHGAINAGDRSATWNGRNQTGYLLEDVDLNGSVTAADRSVTWNNRNKVMQW